MIMNQSLKYFTYSRLNAYWSVVFLVIFIIHKTDLRSVYFNVVKNEDFGKESSKL